MLTLLGRLRLSLSEYTNPQRWTLSPFHISGTSTLVEPSLRFTSGREDTLSGVGAVDEDEDLVVGGGRVDVEVGIEGDLHRTGGVEVGGIETDGGERAVAEGDAGVVDVEGVEGGGGDAGEVALDELADLGGGVMAEEVVEGDVEAVDESTCETASGGETHAQDLLCLGFGVFNFSLIGVHGPETGAPTATYDGADTVFEGGKDALSRNTHSCFS